MNETSVFKVAGSTEPKSLAKAITGAIRQGEDVYLRSIGAKALNQAVKSISIANGMLAPAGIMLAAVPAFQALELDGQEQTAISQRLKQME